MVTLKTKQVKDTVNLTVNWRDIAKKLNPLYEDQGYAPPSDVQMQNAVLKAASALNVKKEKRSNRFYYESSFLDDAVEYILKNPSFKLHKSEKYETRNFAKRLTTEYLNAFDLLVTSSSTLNLQQKDNVEFEKAGWFNLYSLFNFLYAGSPNVFEEVQRGTILQRSSSTVIDDYSDFLFLMEFFSGFADNILKDFDHIIIHDQNKEFLQELFVFYNILDFNKIAKRISENIRLFIVKHKKYPFVTDDFFANVDNGEVSFLLYEDSILDFVSNHKESSIQNGKNGKKVSYFKGDRYFWKQNL